MDFFNIEYEFQYSSEEKKVPVKLHNLRTETLEAIHRDVGCKHKNSKETGIQQRNTSDKDA